MRESGHAVLVVEDDAATRELIAQLLSARGHRVELAPSVGAARRLLVDHKFALVLCDIALPDESGLKLARHIAGEHPETAVLMVSSHDDPDVAMSALAFGAYGYVMKPFRPRQLEIAAAAALRRREEEMAGRRDREALEREATVLRGAVERFERATSSAELSDEETLDRLTRAISVRSHETGDHIERVARLAALLARRVGLPPEQCRQIQEASRLHDIGKVAVSDRVLLKPGALSAEERAEMQRHAEVGHYVLAGSESDVLRLAAEIALSHHERYDGGGYPAGCAGEAIPLEGRIVAIADVFDALTSDRVYRRAYSREEAIELMRRERGRHFDPDLLDTFLAALSPDAGHTLGISA
jgi:putative two-component system response regulator